MFESSWPLNDKHDWTSQTDVWFKKKHKGRSVDLKMFIRPICWCHKKKVSSFCKIKFFASSAEELNIDKALQSKHRLIPESPCLNDKSVWSNFYGGKLWQKVKKPKIDQLLLRFYKHKDKAESTLKMHMSELSLINSVLLSLCMGIWLCFHGEQAVCLSSENGKTRSEIKAWKSSVGKILWNKGHNLHRS